MTNRAQIQEFYKVLKYRKFLIFNSVLKCGNLIMKLTNKYKILAQYLQNYNSYAKKTQGLWV